jgi:predicted metal-dependent phosphoesterase TrpH
MTSKIDLHIHSNYSDGQMDLEEIFAETRRKKLSLISITDHDCVDAQAAAAERAGDFGINYLSGVELNVSFSHLDYRKGKPVSLDFLGYQVDPSSEPLVNKLTELRNYRETRAAKILTNINRELTTNGLAPLTKEDLKEIQDSVDGALGRPHIANYLVQKGIVANRQEAFDQYLVKCNVPKMPLSIEEASELVRGAGGKVVLAHPNDPRGTSLVSLTPSLDEQQHIIRTAMLPHIDGIECWHSRHDSASTQSYVAFAESLGLIVTGGSDCHQQPVLIGSVDVPEEVAEQF